MEITLYKEDYSDYSWWDILYELEIITYNYDIIDMIEYENENEPCYMDVESVEFEVKKETIVVYTK